MQRKLVLRRGRGGWVKVRFGKFSTLKASITYLVPLFRHLFSPVAFRPPSHSWVLQDSLRSLWSLWVGARRTGNIFEKTGDGRVTYCSGGGLLSPIVWTDQTTIFEKCLLLSPNNLLNKIALQGNIAGTDCDLRCDSSCLQIKTD